MFIFFPIAGTRWRKWFGKQTSMGMAGWESFQFSMFFCLLFFYFFIFYLKKGKKYRYGRVKLFPILYVLQPREDVFMNPIFVDNFELIFQKESLFRLASPNLRQWWTTEEEEEEEEGGFQQSDCKVMESGIGTFPSVSPIKTHWSCTDKILCVFNSNLLLQFDVIQFSTILCSKW